MVVPCHNEAACLPDLVPAIVDAVRAAGCVPEVVLVDDGSTDDTLAVMRALSADDPGVTFLSFSRNFGKEPAMYAGLQRTTGQEIVIMDGDGQHPPEMIPRLLAEQRSTGADQVVARRDRAGDPRLRSFASRLFYRVSNRLTEVDLVSGDGDFRLLTRRAADAVLALAETNRFSKGIFAWIGFGTAVVQYPNQARSQGSSRWNRSRLVNYGIEGLMSFNSRPLRVVIHAGWLAVILAVGYLIWLLVYTALFGIRSPGYVTVIAAIVFIGGLQLISIGVVGEYVGRIFMETKRRPMFLIAEASPPPAQQERHLKT